DKNATDSQVHELNRWYHFVGTYDGANIKIYKDGKLVGTTPATGNLAVSDVTAKIGTYQGTNYNFNGQIDDVRIYNYALTQEQIKLLYNDNAAVRF
ncbi:MAG TPA: LamG domain-containing protein, partial [Candidatus Woesebacteria bacterium]|nr:LamG domain-containing protein [Candidatus Woesebacteria bacterium]